MYSQHTCIPQAALGCELLATCQPGQKLSNFSKTQEALTRYAPPCDQSKWFCLWLGFPGPPEETKVSLSIKLQKWMRAIGSSFANLKELKHSEPQFCNNCSISTTLYKCLTFSLKACRIIAPSLGPPQPCVLIEVDMFFCPDFRISARESSCVLQRAHSPSLV